MSKKQELDKYYTPVKEIERFCEYLYSELAGFTNIDFIEPSAGDGRWCTTIKKYNGDITAYDLAPDVESVTQQDFLTLTLPKKVSGVGRVFIGNPPYGKCSGTANKFFNKCAELEADLIAMVLPSSFGVKLQSRGRIDNNYSLYSEHKVSTSTHFEVLDGTTYKGDNKLQCSFMVWVNKQRRDHTVPFNPAYKIVRPLNSKIKCLETNKTMEQGVGEIDVDFSIITHGTRTGCVLDFDLTHKVSVKQFVKVTEGYDLDFWRERFTYTDYSYFKSANILQKSISTDEIRCCVEGSKYKLDLLNKDKYTLRSYIK
tara:strand:+ start:110 stop:1048 length:939 start_codon:yes stop_codon:yes gene_type:complete